MFIWKTGLSEADRIRQNISNMTELRKGDLAYDRELGVISEWIDKQNGTYSAEVMSDLTEVLNEREPRAASNIEVTDDNRLIVILEQSEDEDE